VSCAESYVLGVGDLELGCILIARSTESDRIRACACGLRNRATCKMPAASATLMSSVNHPAPGDDGRLRAGSMAG
jgi:hypothetical protein